MMNLNRKYKISIEDDKVKIEIPLDLLRHFLKKETPVNWSILKSIRGIWRHKKIDALDYQKAIRQEWD